MDTQQRVCPVERSGSLDNVFRKWLQNPNTILAPFIKPGTTAMDYGCGPGFFTLEMARLVGPSGRVIAVDLQAGMLNKLSDKVQHTELADRIELHRCEDDRIGLSTTVDFVLAFYMVHEVPDQRRFFEQIAAILNPGGAMLVVEPPIHVTKAAFHNSIDIAQAAGLHAEKGPRVLLSKSALLRKRPA
jgi:ubiquinone/menaquinone biosynthesis C-methylase UbiE